MKKIIIILVSFAFATVAYSQKMITRSGEIKFDATVPGASDSVVAESNTVSSIFDKITGDFVVQGLVKSFKFKMPLMEEHFNENYMESDKFPNSVFKGKVTNMDKVNVDKDGSYPVNVKGTLEIHGVKKDVESNGTMKVVGGNISASSEFTVVLEDYKIAIPRVVKDKLSKTAIIKINCTLSIAK